MSDRYRPKDKSVKTVTIKTRELKLSLMTLLLFCISYAVACSTGVPEVRIAWAIIVMVLALIGTVATAACFIVNLHDDGGK